MKKWIKHTAKCKAPAGNVLIIARWKYHDTIKEVENYAMYFDWDIYPSSRIIEYRILTEDDLIIKEFMKL